MARDQAPSCRRNWSPVFPMPSKENILVLIQPAACRRSAGRISLPADEVDRACGCVWEKRQPALRLVAPPLTFPVGIAPPASGFFGKADPYVSVLAKTSTVFGRGCLPPSPCCMHLHPSALADLICSSSCPPPVPSKDRRPGPMAFDSGLCIRSKQGVGPNAAREVVPIGAIWLGLATQYIISCFHAR